MRPKLTQRIGHQISLNLRAGLAVHRGQGDRTASTQLQPGKIGQGSSGANLKKNSVGQVQPGFDAVSKPHCATQMHRPIRRIGCGGFGQDGACEVRIDVDLRCA